MCLLYIICPSLRIRTQNVLFLANLRMNVTKGTWIEWITTVKLKADNIIFKWSSLHVCSAC